MMASRLRAVLAAFIIAITGATMADTAPVSGSASEVGRWSRVRDWPVKAVHATLLPSGKVLVWPSYGRGDVPFIWGPGNGTVQATPPGFNTFCSGHTLMADGRLFVAGGHVTDYEGVRYASAYDWVSGSWAQLPDMNHGRWYPTTTLLANGDVLAISGYIVEGETNTVPQVFDVSKGRWRTLSNAALQTPEYPFTYQAPNGRVFMAGPGPSRYLDIRGKGSWGPRFDRDGPYRAAGTSVMYAPGRILISGGGPWSEVPTATAEVIDLTSVTPGWRYTGSMASPRRHANATLLPNGFVLVTGGTAGVEDDETMPVLDAEWWQPGAGRWRTLARSAVYRGYHSIALLLRDGRVLVAGGEKSGSTAEIYFPPYLFKGPRPRIKSAPKQVDYRARFIVTTPDAADIRAVRWIRLGSVTHSFDQSQRMNKLAFVRRPGSLVITAPPGPRSATPGHYMLFILNRQGVPSIARIVRLGNPPPSASKTSYLARTRPRSPSSALAHDHGG